jgi:hypothetical protein
MTTVHDVSKQLLPAWSFYCYEEFRSRRFFSMPVHKECLMVRSASCPLDIGDLRNKAARGWIWPQFSPYVKNMWTYTQFAKVFKARV